ncbi:MAG: hypothetical protein S4CHLAM81_00870 [Chlamydiales bacterium]|nr:hypothetical protein [Chlamydiales bacterium]MCH9634883.1 hypothetical protein [Chlamydiales bacterium]MCH9703704.1 hypothetical protein [Chlamydiota bacterium]
MFSRSIHLNQAGKANELLRRTVDMHNLRVRVQSLFLTVVAAMILTAGLIWTAKRPPIQAKITTSIVLSVAAMGIAYIAVTIHPKDERQFFRTLRDDMKQRGMLDGASPW